MAEIKQILIEIDLETGGVVGGSSKINSELKKIGANAKVVQTEVNKAAAAMQKNLAGSAGIAGAAATELGRTISDLPFGITAVTNNISQLGNMFALLVTSAGGVTAALTAMRTALMGPVGILIAFQAVVAGVEMFAQSQRKAKKETDDLKKSIDEINELYGDQRARLIALGNAAIFGSESQRKALAENMKEVKAYLEAAETTGEVTSQVVDEAVRLGLNLIEARRNAAIAEQEYLEVVNTAGRDSTAAAIKFAEASQKVIDAEKALNLQKQEDIKLTAKRSEKEEERIRLQEAALRRLQDQTDKFIRDKEASEIAQLDRSYQREIEAAEKVGADTTNIEEFYANERVRVKEEFAEKRAKNERDANYKIESAQRDHNIKMARLEAQLAGNRIQESNRTEKEILDVEISILESRIKVLKILAQTSDVAKRSLDEALIVLGDLIKRRDSLVENNLNKISGALDTVKQGLSSLNEILNAQAQREMDIEEAKTIAQNDALRSRLRNEQLSAEQRDAINQQISRNEAKLIEEQNKMKEKAFKRDKAFRISMGLIDTASSTLKAFGSQIIPGDPTSLVRAKIAAKLAAVFGLAQVAAIASQSFVPQASPSPNLTAQTPGGGAGAEPQFNVIGATGQNQLAAAIAATQQQPVKAYVVSNDVTTAQSLDRNIVAEASL